VKEKAQLSIIYLGQKGGGAKTALQISEELVNSENFAIVSICIRGDNEIFKEYDQSKVIKLFDRLISVKTILKTIKYFFSPTKLLEAMHISQNSICLVPMISPLGLIIESILKVKGITVIRLLHDYEKHPGDRWPPNFLIKNIVKRSNILIALSEDVANKIRELNPQIKVATYPHPSFEFSKSLVSVKISPRYILFVGRIRKYKGVENLIAAFNKVDIEGTDLVIAGEGKLKARSDSRIKFINRWLKEEEISDLIKNALVVVFPYIEASQSGILPYCVRMNKKIVITPLPGLIEQASSFANAFIAADFTIDALAASLDIALTTELQPTKIQPRFKNIEVCLLELGISAIQ
jgi:glycosyltransferase involved in cell wall biosynthesis